MNNLIHTISASLYLDWMWIRHVCVPKKWQFLLRKYALLFFPSLHRNTSKRLYRIKIANRYIFLPTIRYISFFQNIFIEHRYLRAYIPKHATIIDIGAHLGEFALMCHTSLQAKEVFSFEPIRDSYQILARNTPYTAYNDAICSNNHVALTIPALSNEATAYPDSDSGISEQATCISLDAIPEIQALSKIDLVKIDVEGMEYEVLQECANTLQKTKYVLVEITLERPSGKAALATLTLIQELIPGATMMRIGPVYPNAAKNKQLAADFLFHNSQIR